MSRNTRGFFNYSCGLIISLHRCTHDTGRSMQLIPTIIEISRFVVVIKHVNVTKHRIPLVFIHYAVIII